MSLGFARINDITNGVCSAHKHPITESGIIISGSGITYSDSESVARIGDIVVAGCGHTGIIIAGSGITFSDGIGNSRLTDTVTGSYVGMIIQASGITFTE